MSLTPLKINVLGSFLQNQGLTINPDAENYMGTSTSNTNYAPGILVTATVLDALTQAINVAYDLINAIPNGITQTEYNNLISIGSTTIPALGNSKPSSYTLSYTGAVTRHGYLRLYPLQAYNEFYINNGSYSDFISTFNTCNGKRSQLNDIIKPLNKSLTFLDGHYSNMNDLITSDITGVNLSTFYWGQDLIATGRAIDLAAIRNFGSPTVLLRTLDKNKARTKSLNDLLFDAGFTSATLDEILTKSNPNENQEKLLYEIFQSVTGTDLADICTILNCQTFNLESLADLIDVQKLFPNSYKSLTFPIYNSRNLPTNSKTYYLIYSGDGVDIKTNLDVGDRLSNILPADLAYSCDAFSIAMLQISNIETMNIEKFSQTVTNLENVNNLGVNGTQIPTNVEMANYAINVFAKGSGSGNTYTMCDFFGCMTDLHYDWASLYRKIFDLQSSSLSSIYDSILSLLNGPGPYTTLQGLIDNANNEIDNIMTANLSKANELNTLYSSIGTKLVKEKNARTLALPTLNYLSSDSTDVSLFADSLSDYGTDTESCGTCQVLTSIADTTLIGGNSLIAAMREARNAKRLGYTGGTLNSEISVLPLVLPRATGTTTSESPVPGYDNCSTLNNIPIVTGSATVSGSLAGSPETTLIPNNLSVLIEPNCRSVLMPNQAIDDVIRCNCDCWDNL